MFSNLFEDRDRKISYLVKLGDCIGRSLRENVALFSIDSHNEVVTYLTQTNKVISGKYKIDQNITLKDIDVRDSSIFEDTKVFDTYVNEKLHAFVENIYFNEYASADTSFGDLLSLWESRVKLDSLQDKLFEKKHRLQSTEKIVESKEFQNLLEVTPQLVQFLKENFDKISVVPEIKNAVNLSNAVSNAFNFPRLTYLQLLENKSYTLKDGVTESIYEMICRQELIKRELLESKKDFEVIWASNSKIRKLASMIFENTENIIDTFCEVLEEVPYIALASKKTLFDTFTNCLAQTDGIGVSEKDVQQFASTIFDMKKDVKQGVIESLNEKYGINVQNLQEPISFKSLINTQIVIFEALSRLSPKGSVLKQVLSEAAIAFKTKSGVEGIDVNDYIRELFSIAGYNQLLVDSKTKDTGIIRLSNVILDDEHLTEVKAALKKEKAQTLVTKDQEYPSDENVDTKELIAKEDDEEETKDSSEAEPKEEPEETEDSPEEGETKSKSPVSAEEATDELSDLEKMVAELADELSTKDKEEKE